MGLSQEPLEPRVLGLMGNVAYTSIHIHSVLFAAVSLNTNIDLVFKLCVY